ncbi:unnamed protein product [Pedinophyceae sp. YPF-701]|nr:unnamed protein product [Pedinophyceae sp. YPF-701]
MGDLHIDKETEDMFVAAQGHLNRILQEGEGRDGGASRVVQLGDLGAYSADPGSQACFDFAKSFLGGFAAPSLLVTGNHDLEGSEFNTDEENLAAWQRTFAQPHFWCCDVGPALMVGISTVRFRSNEHSVHEVHIDDEQVAWLREVLETAGDKPVVVYSHAPPLGCGLKVINEVHVKNRCAWLNHSTDPFAFIDLVESHSNVRLWFSGHFHLSHNYADSVSSRHGTAFVQTGVIGTCNRDGMRQSRVLEMDREGFRVLTVDHHDDGRTRVDVEHSWSDPSDPVHVLPDDELLCDPSDGFLCGRSSCAIGEELGGVTWLPAGGDVMLAVQDEHLIQYSVRAQAAVGAVSLDVRGRTARLLDENGAVLGPDDAGDSAVAVELVAEDGSDRETFPRHEGGFYLIHQPNKWEKRMREQGLEELIEIQRALRDGKLDPTTQVAV